MAAPPSVGIKSGSAETLAPRPTGDKSALRGDQDLIGEPAIRPKASAYESA
jgi:hypothetical protein